VEITLENCPLCGGALEQTGEEPEIHQQVELVEKPFKVTEYQLPQYWCEHCQTYHTGTLPYKVAKTGLFGISLIALVAYMKGRCHCFPNSPVNGYNNLTTATSYNNTGSVYYRSGDYAKALEYYQKDLAIKEEVLGKNHPNTVKVSGSIAKAYNNRGFAYDEKGDYDQAITDFEMVVKLAPNDDEYREYLERAKAEKARKHAN
jgi:tetratricopeptide (TPR) repeat protein